MNDLTFGSMGEALRGLGIIPIDPCTLADCPVGLFFCGSQLCLKTEYSNNSGKIEAYIVSSGEFFAGDAPQTVSAQRATQVLPVDLGAMLTAISERWAW